MSYLIKPDGYKPVLDLKQTELAIKQIKEFFHNSGYLVIMFLLDSMMLLFFSMHYLQK